MARRQQQSFCHRCDRQTIHTREIERPNHMVHWLIILFCCGAWVPFYALLCLFPKKWPWMCSVCGESMGHVPAEVKQARREAAEAERAAERAAAEQRRHEERERRAAERAGRLAEWEAARPEREARAQQRKEAAQAAAGEAARLATSAGQTIWEQVRAAVGQVNGALAWACGEDVVLLRIAQFFLALTGLVIAAFVLWTVAGLIF